jgi:DNA-binding Xre family transcriptional regulator
MTEFGKQLVAQMKKRNINDTQLAVKLGIATPNIHALKYRTENPRTGTLEKLARVLKIEPNELWSGKRKSKNKKANDTVSQTKSGVWIVVRKNGIDKKTRVL